MMSCRNSTSNLRTVRIRRAVPLLASVAVLGFGLLSGPPPVAADSIRDLEPGRRLGNAEAPHGWTRREQPRAVPDARGRRAHAASPIPEPSSFLVFVTALLIAAQPMGRSGRDFFAPSFGAPARRDPRASLKRLRARLPRIAKRGIDVVGGGLAILLLAPLLPLVALAIRCDSPGPVFFGQTRSGKGGRPFRMWKLRTMTRDAESLRADLEAHNEMEGPVFKLAHDPRITRVGRWLRRLSLDETPQFWNVLRGEMSLVGPRPAIPSEVEQYGPRERCRLEVVPGITCTWQVSGRNEIDFERWIEMDLEYIERWSLSRDVSLLVRTVPAVLSGRGAS